MTIISIIIPRYKTSHADDEITIELIRTSFTTLLLSIKDAGETIQKFGGENAKRSRCNVLHHNHAIITQQLLQEGEDTEEFFTLL